MKTKLLFLLGLLTISSDLSLQANPITRAQARQVAEALVGIDDYSADDVPLSPYYIFSRGKGRGVVIVSGDDTTAPILGYTESGDEDDLNRVAPLRQMLDTWADRIAQVMRKPTPTMRKSVQARALADYKAGWHDVAALIKTHWHQSSPYNDMTPTMDDGTHCATGCVATAGAQMAYYFRRDNPDALQYDTPTYGYGVPVTVSLPKGTPIEWDLMRLSGSGTVAQNKAVATLMYALGASAGLTYGASTSGHNYREGHWNMADALRGQFRLNYAYKGKWEMTQQAWEELIYSNLCTRRPMLYSGVHPDNGGHSVVLDGYQAKTGLFHFNFGWGGQGDGWYTVDDATGMNGFVSSQDLVYNITPQVQNIAGEILPSVIWHKAPSTLNVRVSNDGTLDFRGVVVYAGPRNQITGQVLASDMQTLITPETIADLKLTMTCTTKGTVYVFVCDKNKRIIDSCQVEVLPTVADLHLNSIVVDAGTEYVSADDIDFRMVNNTTVNVTARLTNGDKGTYCQPAFQCYLEQYDQGTQEWTRQGNTIINTLTFEVGQTRDAIFTFTDLLPGALYRAYLNKPAVATTQSTIMFETPDSIVYFTVREPDLTVTADGRRAVVSGRWNEMAFRRQSADERICSFDLTTLQELNSQPVAANPNALFYVNPGCELPTNLYNVVTDDVCNELRLEKGFDFAPMKPFTAVKATLTVGNAEAGHWEEVALPFGASVPYGMQAKQASEWYADMVDFVHTTTISPMTPVVFLTGHRGLNSFEASQVTIGTDTLSAKFDGQLVVSTVSTAIEPQWLMIDEYLGALNYLSTANGGQVAAFCSYVVSNTGDRMRLCAPSEALSDAYYSMLSQSIDDVYAMMEDRQISLAQLTATLTEELKKAEDMLSYRTAQSDGSIDVQRRQLAKALAAFDDYFTEGVEQPRYAPPSDTETLYYNLSGQRVNQPERGIFIVKQGSMTRKILIK